MAIIGHNQSPNEARVIPANASHLALGICTKSPVPESRLLIAEIQFEKSKKMEIITIRKKIIKTRLSAPASQNFFLSLL